MSERARLVDLRWLSGGMFAAWTWKWSFFRQGFAAYELRPLHDSFFPEPLQQLPVLLAAYAPPLVLCVALQVLDSLMIAWLCLSAFALGSAVLLLHQCSYNDATFVTSSWASLWGLWYLHASRKADPELAVRGAFLAQVIVALLFFGGALGKLTPGYWDGSVLYRLYFEEGQHWSFAWLRAHLSGENLRYAATLYSRAVVGIEGFLATLPLWPSRLALQLALVALGLLVLLNNFLLLSVLGSLMALCAVALLLLRRAERDSEQS
jgi:hypothetical protein